MAEKMKDDSMAISTRKSPRCTGLPASGNIPPSSSEPEKKYMTTRAKTDPEGAARKRQSITSMFRAANISKADDGSLIYRRRQSGGELPSKKKTATTVASRMKMGGVTIKQEKISPERTTPPVDRPAPPPRRKRSAEETPTKDLKKKRSSRTASEGEDGESDFYCWMCHKEGHVICCELCPRVYHARCLGVERDPVGEWVCPECEKIMRAECEDTRSKSMSMVSVDQLCVLLKYALSRMKCQGSDPFQKPVDIVMVPDYPEYVFNAMDLSQLERNIKRKQYGSTEAFLADAKWILHNCIVFNGAHHKLTAVAKSIIKISQHEMNEIEICADCYYNSCTKRDENWFCEPCRAPHPLVWAKMKGYPFWPAKALREVNGQVDARFFGEHDRAWVAVNQVYMLSKEPPTNMKNGRKGFDESMEELDMHIDKIKDKFGSFEYAPFRTPYDMKNPYMPGKVKTPTKGSPRSPGSPAVKRRFIEKSPQSSATKSASAVKAKYSAKRRFLEQRKSNEGAIARLSTGQSEEFEDDGSDDNLYIHDTPDVDMEASNESAKTEPYLEEEDQSLVSHKGEKSSAIDTGVFASTAEEDKNTSPMEIPPLLTQAEAPKTKLGNLEIIDRISKKLAELEKVEEESDSGKSDGREKEVEKNEGSAESEKTDSIAEKNEKDSDILREILEKAKQHENDTKEEDIDLNLPAKPNPFLEKLVESCKEKLGVTEEEIMSLPGKDKDDIDDDSSFSSDDSSTSSSSDSSSDAEDDKSVAEKDNDENNDNSKESEKAPDESVTKSSPAHSRSEEKTMNDISSETATSKKTGETDMELTVQCEDEEDEQAVFDLDTCEKQQSQLSPEAAKSAAELQKVSVKVVQTREEKERLAQLAVSLSKEQDKEKAAKLAQEIASMTSPIKRDASPVRKSLPSPSPSPKSTPTKPVTQAQSPVPKASPVMPSTPSSNASVSPSKAVKTPPVRLSEVAVKKDEKGQEYIMASVGGQQEKISIDFKTANFDVTKAADKLVNTLQETMQDMCRSILTTQATTVMHASLQLEVERMKWKHEQEIAELKHNMAITLAEMRNSLETAREILLQEQEKKWKEKMEKAVEEAKKKQWCANCGKEAIFYCCWNTSYCDYPCQQAHWPKHMSSCTQNDNQPDPKTSQNNSETPSEKVQQARHEFEQVIQRHQSTNSSFSNISSGPQIDYVTSSGPPPFHPHLPPPHRNISQFQLPPGQNVSGSPMMLQIRPGMQARPPMHPQFIRGPPQPPFGGRPF